MSEIEASFVDGDLETLRESIATLEQGHSTAVAIEDSITRQVGAANAVSMEHLSGTLRTICDFMARQLRMRESDQPSDELQSDAPTGSGETTEGTARAAGPAIAGEIRSREDVLRTLDKICEYYDRYEPSSPLPMLLKRAKRLATKSFMDILEDLTPDALSRARLIGGLDQDDHEE